MNGNDGSFDPEEPDHDADTPTVECPDCPFSLDVEDVTADLPWYCPECGERTEVAFEPATPKHVHSYQLS